METKRFERRQEDFRCQNCGAKVRGDGYTNHCPRCLWSKHVDAFPGDRLSECRGMMEPIGVKIKGGKYAIVHRCQKCGMIKNNKTSPTDDMALVVQLSTRVVAGTRN
ncbi:MAG: RNHCP domain-containing protein [Patescibacteria group bacterium]